MPHCEERFSEGVQGLKKEIAEELERLALEFARCYGWRQDGWKPGVDQERERRRRDAPAMRTAAGLQAAAQRMLSSSDDEAPEEGERRGGGRGG